MESIYWLIAFIALLIIEILTLGLTTIWFAAGTIAAFIASLFGIEPLIQILIFIIVSLAFLIIMRPITKSYLNKKLTKTNVESLIGQTARVTGRIENAMDMGIAVVNGQEWTARALDDGQVFNEGEMVIIADIKGVKLFVKEKKEENS